MKNILSTALASLLLVGCATTKTESPIIVQPQKQVVEPPKVDSRLLVTGECVIPKLPDGAQLRDALAAVGQGVQGCYATAARHSELARWVCEYLGQTCPDNPAQPVPNKQQVNK